MQGLGRPAELLWLLSVTAQAGLLCLLLLRKAARVYPAFSVYIFMTLAQSGVLLAAYTVWGFSSSLSWRIAWATQCFVLGARALVVAEVCRHVLGPFRGIWLLARWLLLGCASVVLCFALMAADHEWRLALTTAELGLELATASVIVFLLLFARYYDVVVAPPLRLLAVGLCLYSCFSVVNDTVVERWLTQYVSLWNTMSMVSFLACLFVWGWALRKPAAQPTPAPLMLDRSAYREIIPDVNWRLRLLNEHLIQFWRLEAPRT